ncbi:ferritin-like domain-containing protein [Glycocaulis profundi]|nr:ferritin-like domain-containing protein [Glycocaulis profundi]
MTRDVRLAALDALTAAEPEAKCAAAHEVAEDWRAGRLAMPASGAADITVPPPGRPDRPELVPPAKVPRRRLNSPAGRAALLHAIAHIEFNAIDLAFDLVARFAADPRIPDDRRTDFIGDWITVGADEARHFAMVDARLRELDSHYGALPAHGGLWQAAEATADDLAARLAIAPMVLEARGLDVTPGMAERLRGADDHASADILTVIYNDEISHVAAGARWFEVVCDADGVEPLDRFHFLVSTRFRGGVKPPFNIRGRSKAGLPQSFYQPLSSNPQN